MNQERHKPLYKLVIYPEDTVRYVLLHWYILRPLLYVIREEEETSGFMGSLDLRLLQAAVFPMTSQSRACNIQSLRYE